MKKDIHFLLKRIEWYNSWRKAMELLSALFPSARARTERTGHVRALKWGSEGFSGESAQHAQPRPGWGSGWRLAGLTGWMAPGPAWHCHGCMLPSPRVKPMPGTTQMRLEHRAVSAGRPIMGWGVPPKGSFFCFVLLKDYFSYIVASECRLWLNHRNGYFPKCLPFVEYFPFFIPPL